MDTIFSPASLTGSAQAPASKSEAHRRLLCAGLTRGTSVLTGFMHSEDTAATLRCVKALGAAVRQEGDVLTVTGGASRPALMPVYDCGESGSTLRFFVPIALALTHGGVFRMHGRLGRRPMDIYRELFVPRGVLWRMGEGADGTAELTVAGGLEAGSYVLPGNVSSQFVSGLLFALPLLPGLSGLTVTPPVESAGYIAMTVQALRDSGIRLEQTGDASWKIPGGQQYAAVSTPIHGDWSQAAVLLCAGALGGDVTVTGLQPDSLQGDRAVLQHLKALGAQVEETAGAVRVRGGSLKGAVLDMRDTPDIAPMLALVCQLAQGESRLTGCGRLRIKESDRLEETVRLLNCMGGSAQIVGEDLVLQGVSGLKGGMTLPATGDHRMVMLASLAALRADAPVTVPGAEALTKSWPDYLAVYRALGGKAE